MLADKLRAASKTVVPAPVGQVAYTTPGTYLWTVPAGVTSISAVCVGAGGGSLTLSVSSQHSGAGGGALAYVNNIQVYSGEQLTVVVGAGVAGGDGQDSTVKRGSTILVGAGGGKVATRTTNTNAPGGSIIVGTGGNGGAGGVYTSATSGNGAGGGGAGGYSGSGGNGSSSSTMDSSNGTGGGGGGGARGLLVTNIYRGGGGGGVGLLGEGASGLAGQANGEGGGGGSGGATPSNNLGGLYGGGRAGLRTLATTAISSSGVGTQGAVRIIWGFGRAFPSTNTQDT